jgi:hypothetical protein
MAVATSDVPRLLAWFGMSRLPESRFAWSSWLSACRRRTRNWMNNRRGWKEKRRVRDEVLRWQKLANPLTELQAHSDPSVQRVAQLVERLEFSTVLDIGLGMGEAVLLAVDSNPEEILPLIQDLAGYSDCEILGACVGTQPSEAVALRQALLIKVRLSVLHLGRHPAALRPDLGGP